MEKKLNSLGEAIVDAKDNAKLDASIKRLLSQKPILAFLLKQVVKEFSGFTEDEIMTMIDTISVATIPVDPGSTNNMITGAPQESTIPGESRLTYDIRFFAAIPGNDEKTEFRLIINVEAQGEPNETYDFESRGILYCGRMLSEQLGRNVTNSHYERLQKVYSIWIIMNCPQRDANTITEYGIERRVTIGNYVGNPRTDLLSIVMIRLPKDDEWDKAHSPATELTRMLSTLLSNRVRPEEKIEVLENDYGIEATEGIRKEVNDMCNYAEVLAKNIATKVANETATTTLNEATDKFVRNLLSAGKFTDAEIAGYSGASLNRVQEIRAEEEKKKESFEA